MSSPADCWIELEAKHRWFHVLRTAILDGRIAEMGPTAWAVYCTVKAYTHMETGVAWPSQATIARHVGVSVDTVARATEKLIDMGMLRRELVGRRNTYRLVETFPLERAGERVGEVRQDYVPLEFQPFIERLKEYAKNGDLPPGVTINVTVNVTNINQGDHSTVNIQQVVPGSTAGARSRALRDIG